MPCPSSTLRARATGSTVDQIAYTSQDILDAETRLLRHAAAEGAPALSARLVARHASRKIKGVRLEPDQATAITKIARFWAHARSAGRAGRGGEDDGFACPV